MGGVGVRAWDLAQALAPHAPVAIVARGPADLHHRGITFVNAADDDACQAALDEASAVISYDLPDTRKLIRLFGATRFSSPTTRRPWNISSTRPFEPAPIPTLRTRRSWQGTNCRYCQRSLSRAVTGRRVGSHREPLSHGPVVGRMYVAACPGLSDRTAADWLQQSRGRAATDPRRDMAVGRLRVERGRVGLLRSGGGRARSGTPR